MPSFAILLTEIRCPLFDKAAAYLLFGASEQLWQDMQQEQCSAPLVFWSTCLSWCQKELHLQKQGLPAPQVNAWFLQFTEAFGPRMLDIWSWGCKRCGEIRQVLNCMLLNIFCSRFLSGWDRSSQAYVSLQKWNMIVGKETDFNTEATLSK